LAAGGLVVLLAGCGDLGGGPEGSGARPRPEPEPTKVNVGQNIFLEVQGKRRRVLISARVCLRRGVLEGLLTRTNKKEHEYILAADVDARKVHEALVLARAEPGEPVRFQPDFAPARGTPIKVNLIYEQQGKRHTVHAGSWIKNLKTSQTLDTDWVFAGSQLVENPLNPGRKTYLANEGDLICVCNMESALLDLPIRNIKGPPEQRSYVAFTERIPPRDTPVVVALEPHLR
jgi:hypothetical protein